MDGWIRGASAEYDAACAYGDRLDSATEIELAELLADEGSVEEAISENADVVRVKLAELTKHPEQAGEIAAFLNGMIRSYMEPVARRMAERGL